jgi:hypothetical protein
MSKALLLFDINRYQVVAAKAGIIADFAALHSLPLLVTTKGIYSEIKIQFIINIVPDKYVHTLHQQIKPFWGNFLSFVQEHDFALAKTHFASFDLWERSVANNCNIVIKHLNEGYDVFIFDPDQQYKIISNKIFTVAPSIMYPNTDIDLYEFLKGCNAVKDVVSPNKKVLQRVQNMIFVDESGTIV